jgi:hypothetical protein
MKKSTPHAEAAKLIRKELKQAFPPIKFSVISRSYAGGSSIDVSWTNGPTFDQVNSIIKKYEYGSFDPRTDMYSYTNSRKDIPQVQYAFANREISVEVIDKIFLEYKKTYSGWDKLESWNHPSSDLLNQWGYWTAFEYINKELRNKDLT